MVVKPEFIQVSPTTMKSWFRSGFQSINSFTGLENINTSSVTDISYLFHRCSSANSTIEGISGWDTSKVTTMGHIFQYTSFAIPPEIKD